MIKEHKAGFVSIIGRPNVGKSTLLNHIIGQKIAIMSNKPQTTRNTILGIYTEDDAQIIFTDTPGIHKPHAELGRRMNKASFGATKHMDAILFMVSAEDEIGMGDKMILDTLKGSKTPVYLLLNKVDLLRNKEAIMKHIVAYTSYFDFAEVYPISALKGNNVPELIESLKGNLKVGPQFYPADTVTDHPERFIMAELIREKVLRLTSEEVPHSVAVTIDSMKTLSTGQVEVYATIYVLRTSQKVIILGKGGDMIKRIKNMSKRDIKNLLGSSVHLDLWVKVKKDWINRPDYLSQLGYNDDNY